MVELLNNLIENVRNFGLERVFKRYYSVYRAAVVDNKDLQKRGRIKVKVPQLFGELTLPVMVEPLDFRNSAAGKGEFFPPDIGDWTYVMFEGGDQRFPLYMGGWYAKNDLDPVFTHGSDGRPLVRGYKDKFGSYWTFDQTPGKEKIKLKIPGENFIEMSVETGKESVRVFNKDQDMVFDRAGIRVTDKFGNKIDMKSGGVDETVVAAHNVAVAGAEGTNVGGGKTDSIGGAWNVTVGGVCNLTVGGTCKVQAAKIELNGAASGVTTMNGHLSVIDLITGVPIIPSPTVFSDV